MKCAVLAAGYATRLYPLTENFPKPLLEVNEKTILDHLLEDIDKSGKIDEYIINGTCRNEQIDKAIKIKNQRATHKLNPIPIFNDGGEI